MIAIPVKRQDLDLPDSVLRLTRIRDDRLILAELIDSSIGKDDILTTIRQAGIRHGFIDSGIDLLSKGQKGQVPLARAEVMDLPARTSNVGLELPMINEVAVSGRFELLEEVDVSFPVKAGDILLTIDDPPKTIIRYPDGQERILREHKSVDPKVFLGENTSVNKNGNAIVTDIDGLAHTTVYGSVSVYPSEKTFSVGGTHGNIRQQSAFVVEQNVGDGAQVETVSSLVVQGAVHGAYLQAAGNIQIASTAGNSASNHEVKIIAGQSLRCLTLEDTPVWAGSHVIVAQGMVRCDIECLDTVITPMISASNVTVGNRLIVRDVEGQSMIKMGNGHIADQRQRDKEATHNQHSIRYSDLEQGLYEHRSVYGKTRENLVRQIEVLRNRSINSSQKQKAKQMVIRLFNSMSESLEIYKKDLDEYISAAEKMDQEQVALDYYQLKLNSFNDPHILVFGTMETGTLIEGPVDKLTLNGPFTKGRIGLDPHSGKLKLEPLKD